MSQLNTGGFGDELRRELGEHVLLSPTKTAELLAMTEDGLAAWRSKGTGPRYVKTGKRVFYLEADLIAFIEQNRREPNGKAAAA